MAGFIRRIRLTTGWAEWDELERTRIGDRLVPDKIKVTFPSTADRWPAVYMTIEVRKGVPHCTELRIEAHPEGREVRSGDLKSATIEQWVDNIVAEAAVTAVDLPSGDTSWTMTINKSDEDFEADKKVIKYVRRGTRRTVTDEMLAEVARIYRENVEGRPLEAIMAAFGVEHRTAARYVQRARKAEPPLLPKTTPGKKRA
ncbi:MAG: hypothetical protein ACR2FE_03990 [Aeromicrobium sp.]